MPRKTATRSRSRSRRRQCFNEAAARCRGKLGQEVDALHRLQGFNEAAARCRGKLSTCHRSGRQR